MFCNPDFLFLLSYMPGPEHPDGVGPAAITLNSCTNGTAATHHQEFYHTVSAYV